MGRPSWEQGLPNGIGIGAGLLVRFWPDHFFGDLMKFIIDIVGIPVVPMCAIQRGAYYYIFQQSAPMYAVLAVN